MDNQYKTFAQPNKYQHMAAICLVIAAFGLPMFSLLTFISLALATLLWLFSTDFSLVKKTIGQSSFAKCSLALFLCIALSALYSNAPAKFLFKTIVSYREFLLIPVTMCILGTAPQYKKTVVNMLIFSLTVVVLLSCLDAYHPLPFSKSTKHGAINDHYIFSQHITQNVMSSFLVLLALLKATEKNMALKWKMMFCLIALIAIINILFLVRGRTGILTLVFNLLIFGYYSLSVKQRWSAAAFVTFFCALIFLTDNPLNRLVQHTVYEVQAYKQTGEDTSAGLRLAFWQDTWQKIEQNPIVGYGAGSYKEMYDLDLKNPDKPGYSAGGHHPHDELLLIWFEAGILAAVLFLLFVILLAVTAFKTSDRRLKMLQYSVVGMLVIYCIFDVPMLNYIEGMFFWLLISLFFTLNPPKYLSEKK